ncbi:MAG: [protein-PII] uridylyltransferase [Gammaproteobacteria bacterium]
MTSSNPTSSAPVATDEETMDAATFESWFRLHSLDESRDSDEIPLTLYKDCLLHGNRQLAEKFTQGTGVPTLIHARSWLVDQVLRRAWPYFTGSAEDKLALVAVGGYGRSELMPGSDIDLLVLLPDADNNRYDQKITQLLTFLWDIGLEVGHSVRSIEDCVEQSLADITVVTNLMEARLLAGSASLFRRMQHRTGPSEIWNSRDFFEVKRQEQRARHSRYHNTAYNLEPNIKESPGGLRDIQMIAWVANRHFGTASLHELVEREFLTREEYQTLIKGRDLLWSLRFALHTLTGRGEDRLLFDHQRTLADTFGFHDDESRLGVEAFMKQYYRTIMGLSRLNEMLLQLFQENILHPEGPGEPVAINKRFQSRNGYIEISHERVFRHQPFALLEIFLLLEQHMELKGVRAGTIRAIRQNRHLIDDEFRNDIRARSLFMEIIRQPRGITHQLRRMNAYGILAAYLPAFENIVGLMQYDLFHIYTVDEHILTLVRNLRRFTVHEFALEFPLCSHIVATLPKPELLYLAGLFHDIAKGRGGDHSELGAVDATAFCKQHDLSDYDTGLVTWLVANHLFMSSTSQREDISDPVVVNRFAKRIKDTVHLDYLYLLTVADIRATNPELWNNWKDALLKQLYYNTRRALQRGLQDPLERAEHIQQVQQQAVKDLGELTPAITGLWEKLGDEYFLRHAPEQVAHHSRLLLNNAGNNTLVDIQPVGAHGGTEIFISAPAVDEQFSRITAVLDRLGLNVVDAGITTTQDNKALDTFHVLEESGSPVSGDRRLDEIKEALLSAINAGKSRTWNISRRAPHLYRHFPIKTHLDFKLDAYDQRTVMELITADRPGLLSRIGRAFADCKIRLLNAKIVTLGSRAEDVYYITNQHNQPLTDASEIACLEEAIHKYLDMEGNPDSNH